MIGKSLRIGTAVVLACIALVACSSPQDAAKLPAPEVVLQAIPAADQAQVDRIHDMKNWRNPYLIVRPDGVALLDAADSAEIRLKPAELLPALAALPASNWPYGRIVAATENTKVSEPEQVEIRRNRGIVGGMLQDAHVAIKWVPSS
ncbi:MAG TPA: hypothetical protein VIX37_05160 [Candidatus Sulfotelmatobacter sp.]